MFKQPNSDTCFVCGRHNEYGLKMSFYDDGRSTVYADYTVSEQYQGFPGIVHGGIIAAILDEVVGRVALIGDHHHFMMSVTLDIKYRHPVPVNTPLKIVGRTVKLRGRLGKAVGEVCLPDGTIAAEAELVLAALPADLLAEFMSQSHLAGFGWHVDPDEVTQ